MSLDKKDQELHDEMLARLTSLVEYLQANDFGYWLTVGRLGTAANYCGGNKAEVVGAVTNLTERNPQIAGTLRQALDEGLL